MKYAFAFISLLNLAAYALQTDAQEEQAARMAYYKTLQQLTDAHEHRAPCKQDRDNPDSCKSDVLDFSRLHYEHALNSGIHSNNIDIVETRLMNRLENEIRRFDSSIMEVKQQDTENNEWFRFLFNALLVLFALIISAGTIFQLRNYRIATRQMEIEKQALAQLDLRIQSREERFAAEASARIRELNTKADEEFEVFQKLVRLRLMLSSNELDQDQIYAAVRFLDQKPQQFYLPIYAELLRRELDPDIKDAINQAILNLDNL